MTRATGQDPGQAAGVAWADLLAALVDTHGTLTAVAWQLVGYADGDDVASIERALRRLRGRGQRDGGVWGQRVLRVFGVPAPMEARLRWMGLYHSPFHDLPVALCLDQLRLWDRPPIRESRARVWLQLGLATVALRELRPDEACVHIAHAGAALASMPDSHDDARIEHALVEGFATGTAVPLDRAAATLARATLAADDRACFLARLADQRAYVLNRLGEHAAARALYAALPPDDVHPFASYRRDAGAAYGELALGRPERALPLASRACEHAGDGGYVRLRVMGLLLVAKIAGDSAALERARAIATRLGDLALVARVDRVASAASR